MPIDQVAENSNAPILKRAQTNRNSVLALHGFLQDIARNPSPFCGNQALRKALNSQGALAKWCDDDRNIIASSLNTVKRIADQILDGGFGAINHARISALGAISAAEEREKHHNSSTKAGLQIQVEDKNQQNRQALQDMWHLTSALNRALLLWRRCAEQSDNPSAVAICEREQKEIRARLSLCKLPVAKNALAQNDGA